MITLKGHTTQKKNEKLGPVLSEPNNGFRKTTSHQDLWHREMVVEAGGGVDFTLQDVEDSCS